MKNERDHGLWMDVVDSEEGQEFTAVYVHAGGRHSHTSSCPIQAVVGALDKVTGQHGQGEKQ